MGCGASNTSIVNEERQPMKVPVEQSSGCIMTIRNAHPSAVYGCAFTNCGDMILSGGRKGGLRMWSRKDGSHMFDLEGHSGFVLSCSISKHGVIASTSDDQRVRLWNYFLPEGKPAENVSSTTPPVTPGFQGSGMLLACMKGHTHKVYSSDFNTSGDTLLTGSMDMSLRFWDVATAAEASTITNAHTRSIFTCSYSRDSSIVLSGGDDHVVNIWDTRTNQKSRSLTGHTKTVWSVTTSHDDKLALSAGIDGGVNLWDIGTGKVMHTFPGSCAIHSVAFSGDDRHVLSAGRDNNLRVWSIDGTLVDVLRGHEAAIYKMTLSDTTILTCSLDSSLRLWEMPTEAKGAADLDDIEFDFIDDSISEGDPWAECKATPAN
eukprot:TRINITY_DN11021_c5_g1_i1.p1 TRINITY_DN11021_c5_g1~~TRINITY_DN11021_c5_g1_i1.p1  ORF type:complete len:391 (+),score=63.57 TRINITY_DN11021_c5_g1_i1:51-1175(+)